MQEYLFLSLNQKVESRTALAIVPKFVNLFSFEAISEWPLAGFWWHQPEHFLRFTNEATKNPGSAVLPVFSPTEGQKDNNLRLCSCKVEVTN